MPPRKQHLAAKRTIAIDLGEQGNVERHRAEFTE
jgi:hypothetical protein